MGSIFWHVGLDLMQTEMLVALHSLVKMQVKFLSFTKFSWFLGKVPAVETIHKKI